MGERATLQTIAEAVGVSRTTVSNAYSRPDQLNAALRDRILRTATELGYPGPDAAARSLRRGRAGAIGLLFGETLSYAFADPYAVGYLRGLAEAAEGAGVGLLLIPVPPGETAEDTVRSAVVDGFCVYCLRDDDVALSVVTARALPTVSSVPIMAGAGFVGIDERAAGRRVAEHLLRLGHRRMAALVDWLVDGVFTGVVDAETVMRSPFRDARERLKGMRDAVVDAGLPTTALQIVVTGRNTREAGRRGAAEVLDAAVRPTALLTTSDVLALGVLDAAAQRGLSVPAQLSVTGFDDIPQAAEVGLTTVHQPMEEKGRLVGQLLVDPPDGPLPHIVLPTELVARATSGPAPTNGGTP